MQNAECRMGRELPIAYWRREEWELNATFNVQLPTFNIERLEKLPAERGLMEGEEGF